MCVRNCVATLMLMMSTWKESSLKSGMKRPPFFPSSPSH